MDDGSSVDVPRKCYEWIVDYRCYTMLSLEKDLAERVTWGSSQHPVISEFDMCTGGERNLGDDAALSLAFFERIAEKKLMLFVDVEDKSGQILCKSTVTEGAMSNVVSDNVGTQVDSTDPPDVGNVIDWDSLEIEPILEEQIDAPIRLMDEDAMYEFVGLRAEDERAEQARIAAEKEAANGSALLNMELEGPELLVDDIIPGEGSVVYDMEDPPMKVGTIYACMNEFRAAMRQHAIVGQFELGTEKSCNDKFRGYCKAAGCPWAIVARLMHDEKQVRV